MVSPSFNLTKLNGINGFTITGINEGDRIGWSVAGAGDVNNDGIKDIIIGAPSVNNSAGVAYVVFGRKQYPTVMSVSILDGSNGFVINSPPSPLCNLGVSVAGVGDVNNDHIDDIIVGAFPNETFTGNLQAFVIFGTNSFSQTVDVSTLDGTNGFTIIGDSYQQKCTGYESPISVISVAGAGDINADGIADIALGFSQFESGNAYVIFGNNTFSSTVNVSNLRGTNGFKISYPSRHIGVSVANAGDINGDGMNDLMIGATSACGVIDSPSQIYVIYGSKHAFAAQCCNFNGEDGFIISNTSGYGTSSIGDVNKDGLSDFGAVGCGGYGCSSLNIVLGSAIFPANFVFNPLNNFGKTSILDWWYIEALNATNMVSGIGDVNGDNIDDFIVGAPNSGGYGSNYGCGYVIFGNKAGYPPEFNVERLNGINGVTFDGAELQDGTGFAVSGLGDINGDGIRDFAISSPQSTVYDQPDVGSVYVVFGGSSIFTELHNIVEE